MAQNYVCSDYRNNVTCPAAPGNPDIAGLGVVISFTIVALLPVAFAFSAGVFNYLQYSRTHLRATVASVISEGNDIVPVWPKRFAYHLGEPAALSPRTERRLERLTNCTLSILLGLSDQVVLFGLAFTALQIIGLVRGTMNILDFRTLAIMIALCAEIETICFYTLRPSLTGLDMSMLTKLQWRYLDRTEQDEQKELKALTNSSAGFRKSLASECLNIFSGLRSEAQEMIDKLPSTVADQTFSARSSLRIRAAGHIMLLAALPLQLLAVGFWDGGNADGGCPAKCIFSQQGQSLTGDAPPLEILLIVGPVCLFYLNEILHILSPHSMRLSALMIRILNRRIRLLCARGVPYILFTVSRLVSKQPKASYLGTASVLIYLGLMVILSFSYFRFDIRGLYVIQPFMYTDLANSILMWRFLLACEMMGLIVTQLTYLFDWPVIAASASDASQNVGGEGRWTDGQILPLLMLVGTAVVVFQNFGGGNTTASIQDTERTVGRRLPNHAAFVTGDISLDLKISRLIAGLSAWDTSFSAALPHYLMYPIVGLSPIPGDTWSHKGLHHLGLMADPSELASNDLDESKTISISPDQRRELLKEICEGFESGDHNWFKSIGLDFKGPVVFSIDELLSPELDDALGKLQKWQFRLRDERLPDRPVLLMLKVLEHLAVILAVWKLRQKESQPDT